MSPRGAAVAAATASELVEDRDSVLFLCLVDEATVERERLIDDLVFCFIRARRPPVELNFADDPPDPADVEPELVEEPHSSATAPGSQGGGSGEPKSSTNRLLSVSQTKLLIRWGDTFLCSWRGASSSPSPASVVGDMAR